MWRLLVLLLLLLLRQILLPRSTLHHSREENTHLREALRVFNSLRTRYQVLLINTLFGVRGFCILSSDFQILPFGQTHPSMKTHLRGYWLSAHHCLHACLRGCRSQSCGSRRPKPNLPSQNAVQRASSRGTAKLMLAATLDRWEPSLSLDLALSLNH